jgi:DNA repair exonuclease SbcCD ATPase subunit
MSRISSEIKNASDEIERVLKRNFEPGVRCGECGSEYSSANKRHLVSDLKKSVVELRKERDHISEKKTNLFARAADLRKRITSSKELRSRLFEKKSKLQKLISDRQNFLEYESNRSRVESIIEKMESEKNQFAEPILAYRTSVSECKDRLVDIRRRLVIVRSKLSDAIYGVEAFGNSGIKNDIISSKILWLEKRINFYLGKMSDDIRVSLDNRVKHGQSDRIGIIIQDGKKIKPLDYLQWSGGECTRIRLSVEFAINDLIDTGLNLRIIDEGFEDVAIDGVKKILEVMRADSGKRMICISNRPDMRNIFKNSIRVDMREGESVVSQ